MDDGRNHSRSCRPSPLPNCGRGCLSENGTATSNDEGAGRKADEVAMIPVLFNWPAVVASRPSALRTATNALRRHYILPETLLHPAVVDQVRELARLLSAYGLVPTEPQLVAPQAGDTAENWSAHRNFFRPVARHRPTWPGGRRHDPMGPPGGTSIRRCRSGSGNWTAAKDGRRRNHFCLRIRCLTGLRSTAFPDQLQVRSGSGRSWT
jgi:hypothetical protein